MTFDFKSANANLLAVHNLAASVQNLLIDGNDSIGGMPAHAAQINANVARELSYVMASEFCNAYRALPDGDPARDEWLHGFWSWGDLADMADYPQEG